MREPAYELADVADHNYGQDTLLRVRADSLGVVGSRVSQPTERLNAECGECSAKQYEKSIRATDRFREQHERVHELPGCVVVWSAFSENPISDDTAKFIHRWAADIRSRHKAQRRPEVAPPSTSYRRWFTSLTPIEQRRQCRLYRRTESELFGEVVPT